jgi:acetylornithine aminotransferase
MKNFLGKEKELFVQTYKRIPLNISHGDGVHLFSEDGTRYLDFFSGLGVNALGHSHPGIVAAIQKQADRFLHLSNYFIADTQLFFAAKLLEHTKMSKVFLTNSGTEAVEAAIKVVRKLKGSKKEIFSLTNAFHGRTYGGLSLTDRIQYKRGFEPFLPKMKTIIFNDINDLQKHITENTAAVFVEFIQGESGINVISNQFVERLNELKLKYDFTIIADCIQSGIGRTGKAFAYNHFKIKPDIVLVAKSVGGGLPLGALLSSGEYNEGFSFGTHGTTFGGNPLSCAAGIIVLEEIFENGLMKNAAESGIYFINELKKLSLRFPNIINEVRGIGFMIGVEMKGECRIVVDRLLERKVLANCTSNNVLRILPPLISSKTDVDFFLYNLHEVLKIL